MTETIQERVRIPGPRGRLAGELAYPLGPALGSVLLLSPHPYMGGRMRLPLMSSLAEVLSSRGFTTLRFDYSGVGESDGPPIRLGPAMQQFWDTGAAPDDPLHAEEAVAAREWLGRTAGGPDAVIGYSFGASLAARTHDRVGRAIVLIAPTIARHDYSTFSNEGSPTLVLFGDGDFTAGEQQVRTWAASLPGPAELRHFPAGDHFFRGLEARVAGAAAEFLLTALTPGREAAR